jgi:hypothetical protein
MPSNDALALATYHACIPHSAVHLPRTAGLLGSHQLHMT